MHQRKKADYNLKHTSNPITGNLNPDLRKIILNQSNPERKSDCTAQSAAQVDLFPY